jgi:hypothetical protein
VQAEPWLERDKAMIDQLKSIGIEKGKPFSPDQGTQDILHDAAREAHAWLVARYEASFSSPFYEGGHWALPGSRELLFADLSSGPLVVEMPSHGVQGATCDAWQIAIPETEAPGKYLLLAPGQQVPGDVDGYKVCHSATFNIFLGVRLTDPHPQGAKEALAQLQVYPYTQRDTPPKMEILDAGTKAWSGLPPRGLEYWERLDDVIQREPIEPRDIFLGWRKANPSSRRAADEDPERSRVGRRGNGESQLCGPPFCRCEVPVRRALGLRAAAGRRRSRGVLEPSRRTRLLVL